MKFKLALSNRLHMYSFIIKSIKLYTQSQSEQREKSWGNG